MEYGREYSNRTRDSGHTQYITLRRLRVADHFRSLWLHQIRSADRFTNQRSFGRRCGRSPARPCIRAGHRMAQATSEDRVDRRVDNLVGARSPCGSRIRRQAATGRWTRFLQWETQWTWFRSAGHWVSAGEGQWRVTAQRRVRTYRVVVGLELAQLPFQVVGIPEQHMVEKFAPHGPDQALDERGCDRGACGTVLISSISRIRRFALQRYTSNSGS